jgi:A/G-specific adenine glycosylase
MNFCKSRINGTQNERPVKLPKKKVPHHINVAGVIVKKGRVLLALRPSKGLLGGMWEFPNGRVEGDPLAGLAQALKTGYSLRLRRNRQRFQKKEPLGIVHHGYSHFTVSVYAYACELESMPDEKNLKWVWIKDLNAYPMGRIDRQIAHLLDPQSDS